MTQQGLTQQSYQNQLGNCSHGPSGGWQPMASAPRNGTPIEVRCTYGAAPWYGLFRWTDEMSSEDQNGVVHTMRSQAKRWAKVGNDCSGFTEDSTFSWRPYAGQSQAYVDPTGGAQNTQKYWLDACRKLPRKKFLGIF